MEGLVAGMTEPASKTLDDVIAFLNQALDTDPAAISALFLHRTPCNEALAEHPTIQVRENCTVSPLGLLNGFFGIRGDGFGHLTALLETDGKLSRFERTPIRSERVSS